MVPLAYFGINSSAFSVAIDLLIVFLAVIYVALVYWTFADARRRIEDPMLVGCATAAALFPFVGPIVYMILRPPEYLEDVRERELEMQAAEARLGAFDYKLCPHCDYRIERDFLRCPSCLRKLKDRCASCARPLEQSWTICPYCEAEVASATTSRTRRRRSRPEQEPAPSRPPAATRAGRERRRAVDSEQSLDGEDALAGQPPVTNGLSHETALISEPALGAQDLLGETVESDQIGLSEDQGNAGSRPVPASDPSARSRSSRRTRPRSGS
jgi:Double zinc ribbon